MKRFLLFFLILIMLLSLGCAETQPSTGETEKLVASENGAIANKTPLPELSETTFIKLFRDGHDRWWHVISSQNADRQTFEEDGNRYVFLGEDLDTKEEFYEYMEQSWASTWVDQFIERTAIIEHKGKMARLDVDTHPLVIPDDSTARQISESKNEKVFEMSLPCGEYCDNQPMVFHVTVKYVEDQGWRMDKREFSSASSEVNN